MEPEFSNVEELPGGGLRYFFNFNKQSHPDMSTKNGPKPIFIRPDSSREDEMEPEFPTIGAAPARVARNPAKYHMLPRPRVEVFSVYIARFRGPGSYLYGTLTITAGGDTQYLYNRKREEAEFIYPEDNILLTGPDDSLKASDEFNIDVDLMERDDVIPPDYKFSYDRKPWSLHDDRLAWDSYNKNNVYDEPLCDEIRCKYCIVGVNYIVISNAVHATVNVMLIIRDRKFSTANVFGSITAGNRNFPDESVLFKKASHEHIDLRHGQLIPLSRFLVAVPLNSVFIIRANLQDYATISSGVIAKGTAEFLACHSGKFEECIYGQGSKIRVKVDWS
ncbi:hypothetical protein HHK36_019484 [Tetracentron sinense]|uniref:DUF6598 domain-containing protein n=1 Tax=Tetracentron sinense TaxID=13715 RepID=A0A835DA32_TETSI|nr:hypothetical protein HHK36_019484 [Tetracentron sinense]